MCPEKSREELVILLAHVRKKNTDLKKALWEAKTETTEYKNLIERDTLIPSLYNKRGFVLAVNPILSEASRAIKARTVELRRDVPAPIASIVFIDIDNFKSVNDTLGHIAGDELLIRFGELLRRRLRLGDIVARLGGDEFGIALSGRTKEQTVIRMEMIAAEFARTETEHGAIPVSISFGIASSDESPNLTTLLSLADSRMLDLKKWKGGGR